MSSDALTYFIRFILLIIVQILVLNNIQFSGLLNPFLYIYFIIILPVYFPRLGVLVLGFCLGLIIDVFHQTLGIHTFATTLVAFLRPYILTYMAPRDGYEVNEVPGIAQMGYLWFMTFSSILVGIHHFSLFAIESFRLSGFWFTLGKSIGSSILTLILILIIQLLLGRQSRRAYE